MQPIFPLITALRGRLAAYLHRISTLILIDRQSFAGICFLLLANRLLLPALLPLPVTAASLIPIYTIQGNSHQSPLYQQWIDTDGVVTALVADGFYLQDPQGDGDPATSDGIFVYTRQAPTVYVGQCVQVQRAYVDEFYGKTELSRMKAILPSAACSAFAVAPTLITPPPLTRTPADHFEQFEGMVVALAPVSGIVQGPTVHFADGEREVALLANSARPYIDGGRVFQANTPAMGALLYLSNGLGATLPEGRWGDTITVGVPTVKEPPNQGAAPAREAEPVRAILDYNFGKYQLLLWPNTVVTTKRLTSTLPPLDSTTPITDADFTVCSYNAHGLGRGSEQFWEPAAYDQQLAKHARTIAETLQGCMIVALQETGRPEDAARLAELLANAFELEYAVVALPGPNTQSNEFPLTNTLLARRDRVQIVSSALPQGCSPIDYKVAIIDDTCLPGTFPLFNRPPLVVDLTVQGPWGEPFPLTVINNHWKSKGGDETANVVRRTAQAAHVATLVQARLDRNPTTNLLVLGDLNDYMGSVPVETLRTGTAPPLHHTYDRLPALDRYSYIYNGGSQVLDHILATPNLEPLLARVDPVHINADYPGADNEQVALRQRSSDHEPILLQIRPTGVGTLGGNLGFPDLKVTLLLAAATADGQVTALDTIVAETVTDALGDFRFWALDPGRYNLRIDAPAHFSQSAQTGILSIIPGYQMLTAQPPLHRDVAEALAFMQLAPTLVAQITAQ